MCAFLPSPFLPSFITVLPSLSSSHHCVWVNLISNPCPNSVLVCYFEITVYLSTVVWAGSLLVLWGLSSLFYFISFFLYSAIPYKYFVWFPFCYRYEAFLHFFWLWWYVMHLKLYVFLPVTYIFNFYNKPYLLSGCLLCYLGAASCWMRSPACGICQWQKIVMIRSSVCSTIYSIFQQFGSFVYFNFSHLIFCQYHKGWDLFHSTECYGWLYSWVILD